MSYIYFFWGVKRFFQDKIKWHSTRFHEYFSEQFCAIFSEQFCATFWSNSVQLFGSNSVQFLWAILCNSKQIGAIWAIRCNWTIWCNWAFKCKRAIRCNRITNTNISNIETQYVKQIPNPLSSRLLSDMINNNFLTDYYRKLHPTTKTYSHIPYN